VDGTGGSLVPPAARERLQDDLDPVRLGEVMGVHGPPLLTDEDLERDRERRVHPYARQWRAVVNDH
jgi:hypothetical protein